MIRVASRGISGTVFPSNALMVINGKLHQACQPTWATFSVWIPIQTYTGTVTEIDMNGRHLDNTPAAPETGKTD